MVRNCHTLAGFDIIVQIDAINRVKLAFNRISAMVNVRVRPCSRIKFAKIIVVKE